MNKKNLLQKQNKKIKLVIYEQIEILRFKSIRNNNILLTKQIYLKSHLYESINELKVQVI